MRKITFLAVVVFVCLVGATVWVTGQKPNRGIAYVTLSDISPDAADRIELTGAQPATLEKKGDAWYLQNGRMADAMQVTNLLRSAEHVRSADLLTQDASRYAEYSVDDANGTGVRILAGGHEMAQVVVGRPLTGGMAMRKGDAAYKVTGIFPNAFVHDGNAWMERRLFLGAENEDVAQVEISLRDEPPYTLVRTDGVWSLATGPEHVPVADFRTDAPAVQRLVHELAQSRVDAILEQDPGPAVTGFDKAVDTLTMTFKPKSPDAEAVRKTLIIGAEGDNKSRYVQVEGSQDVSVLPGYAVVALRKHREDMRDLRLTKAVDLAHVAAIRVRRGAEHTTLVRKDGVWGVPAGMSVPSGTKIDPTRAQRRAMDVVNARATAAATAVKPEVAGISPKAGQVRLTFEDKSAVALTFGRSAPGNHVYVQGTADNRVYTVTTALRDHLLGMLDTLRVSADGDPLARFDPDGVAKLPPDVRAGLSEHFAQKKREQQALQLMKGRAPKQ